MLKEHITQRVFNKRDFINIWLDLDYSIILREKNDQTLCVFKKIISYRMELFPLFNRIH